jgi:hypothetical protein
VYNCPIIKSRLCKIENAGKGESQSPKEVEGFCIGGNNRKSPNIMLNRKKYEDLTPLEMWDYHNGRLIL